MTVLLALAFSTLLQRTPSPQALLRLERPLTAAEMDTVVSGIRQSLTGVTLRLKESRGADREILMGPAGMPRMIRSSNLCTHMEDGECAVLVASDPPSGPRKLTRFVVLTEFTGEPARRCNGTQAPGELLRRYVLNSATQTWTVTAHEARPGQSSIARPLEMLTRVSLTIGTNRLVGDRAARALIPALPQSDTGDVLLDRRSRAEPGRIRTGGIAVDRC